MHTPTIFALALTIVLSTLHSIFSANSIDDLQVLDHCDEHAFPYDGRSLVTGSQGCSGEPELLGNWMIQVIEDGDVIATEPFPFAWDNHKRINRHVVGVYARNLDTGKPLYLKIPKRYQLAPKDPKEPFAEAIHFGIDGGLVITCQLEGKLGAIVWHLDDHPQIVDFSSMTTPPFPAQLPDELRDVKRFQQDQEGWFYADLSENRRVNIARAQEGGYFVVGNRYTNCEYLGLTTVDGTAWQWKHVLSIGDDSPTIELPANLVPLKRLIFAEYFSRSSIARLRTVDANGLHTQTELSAGGVSSLALSGNQKFAMIDYSIDNNIHSIDETYACLFYDLDSGEVVKNVGLPEVVVYGLTDRMTLLVDGNEKEYLLIEKTEDGSSKPLLEFDVLMPAKE